MLKSVLLSLASVVLLLSPLSCDFPLGSGGGGGWWDEPVVDAGDIALTRYPGLDQLAAWYCPDSPLGEAGCTLAGVDPPPPESEMAFRFALPLGIENPNSFPIPAVEVLAAIDLFPGQTSAQLAVVCVSFCNEGDDACLSAPDADACSSDEPELDSIEDFQQAAKDMLSLYLSGAARGELPPELMVKTIPAGGQAALNLQFDIAPDPLLQTLEQVFLDNIEKVIDEDFTVTIPYSIQGTVWFVIENVGRIGVSYGPIEGEWTI